MIFRVEFKERKDEVRFIKKYKPLLLTEDNTESSFLAWKYLWAPNTLVCYMGFMGYGDPFEIVKECKKKNIGIKFLAWIPINDKNSTWHKEVGRW